MSEFDTPRETPRKTARPAASPKFNQPMFDPTRIEMPEAVRKLAETGVQQARDAYARFKTAAEDTTGQLEDAYLQASKGAAEFNLKALDALRANVNSGFDYARDLFAAKSVSQAVELSASHMRQQFDALTAQAKELTALAQKVTTDASEPIKAGVVKTFKVQ